MRMNFGSVNEYRVPDQARAIASPSRDTGEEITVSRKGNAQRTLARDLVNAIGMIAALNFARERQWFGVINQINSHPAP